MISLSAFFAVFFKNAFTWGAIVVLIFGASLGIVKIYASQDYTTFWDFLGRPILFFVFMLILSVLTTLIKYGNEVTKNQNIQNNEVTEQTTEYEVTEQMTADNVRKKITTEYEVKEQITADSIRKDIAHKGKVIKAALILIVVCILACFGVYFVISEIFHTGKIKLEDFLVSCFCFVGAICFVTALAYLFVH